MSSNIKQLKYYISLFKMPKELKGSGKGNLSTIMNDNLEFLFDDYQRTKTSKKKILKGASILKTIGSKLNKAKQYIVDTIKSDIEKIKKKFPKIYMQGMNEYRKRFCQGKARPLEEGEFHLLCGNFVGPQTKYEKYKNVPAYNGIDECSRIHDDDYNEISKMDIPKTEKAKKIREADQKVLDCYENHKDEGVYYKLAKGAITGKKVAEDFLSAAKGEDAVFYGGCNGDKMCLPCEGKMKIGKIKIIK